MLMTEFFVIMRKRDDDKVYADLHKSIDKIYLTEEDARKAFQDEVKWDLRRAFHIVRLFACTEEEMAEVDKVFQTVIELSKA
jgi:hypothetical protein